MNKNCKMTIGAMLLLTTAFSAFSVRLFSSVRLMKIRFFVPTELPMELQLKITAAGRDLTALTRLVTN